MVEKSQDKEMDKSVAVGNVENNSEKALFLSSIFGMIRDPSKNIGKSVKKFTD